MPHDESLSYLEKEYGPQTFTEDAEEGKITVTGECPRCKGETSKTFRVGQPGIDKAAWAGKPATMICACGATHDRPGDSDEAGCGAYWTVMLQGG